MNDRNITIKDVYLSGKSDDYVVLRDYPNLRMATTFDKELHAPIYSKRMYWLFNRYQADMKKWINYMHSLRSQCRINKIMEI